jgi:hypothetical protein
MVFALEALLIMAGKINDRRPKLVTIVNLPHQWEKVDKAGGRPLMDSQPWPFDNRLLFSRSRAGRMSLNPRW